MKKQRRNTSEEQSIIDLYEKEGMSTYQIAEHLSTYPNKIRRTLKKHGIELKTRSEAQKNALSNGRAKHPTVGRKRTTEERLKISSSVCDYWESMSEDEYKDRCKQAFVRWHAMSEEQRQNICSLAIQAIQKAGKEGSKMEKFVLQELESAGYVVQFHKKSLIPNENLEIDLYIPDIKTIIEVDGPSHFLPIWGEEKLAKQIKADSQKSGLILSKGYLIIRVKLTSDFVSLKSRYELINSLKSLLSKISNKFPPKGKRYIELEL